MAPSSRRSTGRMDIRFQLEIMSEKYVNLDVGVYRCDMYFLVEHRLFFSPSSPKGGRMSGTNCRTPRSNGFLEPARRNPPSATESPFSASRGFPPVR